MTLTSDCDNACALLKSSSVLETALAPAVEYKAPITSLSASMVGARRTSPLDDRRNARRFQDFDVCRMDLSMCWKFFVRA